VSLHAPIIAEITAALGKADLAENQWLPWHVRARADDGILYFGLSERDCLVGQAFLHDIDRREHTAMVGYHIFRAADRGHGTGTAALSMLRDYAFETMRVRRLVAITSIENQASRRIAERCGFVHAGAPREGVHLALYELTAPERAAPGQ
jgi:RimJ/RimL family protein N-acetyltransferase